MKNPEWIGDGGCDADGGYNTQECGWDGGDCCEGTCDEEFSFYPCGVNQPYTCSDPDVGKGRAVAQPAVFPVFHDGFESGAFHSKWNYLDRDAAWEVDDDIEIAAEGIRFAEARTSDINAEYGEAVLELAVSSPNGGTLSFQVQTFMTAPREDLVLKIDDVVVSVIINTVSEWQLEEYEIPNGMHSIKWVHKKNPSNELLAEVETCLGVSRLDDVTFRLH